MKTLRFDEIEDIKGYVWGMSSCLKGINCIDENGELFKVWFGTKLNPRAFMGKSITFETHWSGKRKFTTFINKPKPNLDILKEYLKWDKELNEEFGGYELTKDPYYSTIRI